MKSESLRKAELVFLGLGVALGAFFIVAQIHRAASVRAELMSFQQARESAVQEEAAAPTRPEAPSDFSLWSRQRVLAYIHTLNQSSALPLGILRIKKAHLEVPVLAGVDELTLNQGVGNIPGTSRPGEGGNIGIAGHRDGFFRSLKDVNPGDLIELETPNRSDTYRVDRIVIVEKTDTAVLTATATPTITLVTCYPFYFLGSAPQRYIVIGSMVRSKPADAAEAGATRADAAQSEPSDTSSTNTQPPTPPKESPQ